MSLSPTSTVRAAGYASELRGSNRGDEFAKAPSAERAALSANGVGRECRSLSRRGTRLLLGEPDEAERGQAEAPVLQRRRAVRRQHRVEPAEPGEDADVD